MEFFQYPVAFLISIGVLVAVHEFGHFWAARRVGVRVERFSVGFGPVLWRRKDRQGTEFCLSAIPLGGYVRLLDKRVEPVPEQDLAYEFSGKGPWARIFVYIAGPAINFLFAVLVYGFLFTFGVVRLAPIIDEVTPNSYAAQAGLVAGDEILAIDGKPVKGWETINYALVARVGDTDAVRVSIRPAESEQRVDRELLLEHYRFDGRADPLTALGIKPARPPTPAVVGSIAEGSVAQSIGLEVGDVLLKVDDQVISRWRDLVEAIAPKPDQSVQLLVQRGTEQLSLAGVPRRVILETGDVVGRLGIGPEQPAPSDKWVRVYHYGPIEALVKGIEQTGALTTLLLVSLKKMVLGHISLENLSGPITIAQVAGDSVSYGLEPFLTFLAYLSVSLGVLNLLPIPMLDGGHILYTVIEMLTGRPLSQKAQERGLKVGVILIMAFMSVAFYNDLVRLIQ